MEIKPELTPPVLHLLDKTFPDSLPVLYALRNGAVTSLLADDPDNPTYLIATIPRGPNDNNASATLFESFVVATDIEAAARVLPQGNLLGVVPESYLDAILRARPDIPDPRPDGLFLFHRPLQGVKIPPVVLPDGACVRRLTEADAELVNKYWIRGAGESTVGYVRALLAKYSGAGVETADGKLVSWVVRYENESAGMAYTLEEARSTGYSKACSQEVLREQQNAGVETAYFWTHKSNKSMLAYAAMGGFTRAEGLRYMLTAN
eukprot:m51a1_g7694 hypothetical protein (263) ;mRNA; f:58799-59900